MTTRLGNLNPISLNDSRRAQFAKVLPLLVFIACLLFSLTVWRYMSQRQHENWQSILQYDTQIFAQTIRAKMELQIQLLNSQAELITSSGYSAERLEKVAQQVEKSGALSGLAVVGFAKHMSQHNNSASATDSVTTKVTPEDITFAKTTEKLTIFQLESREHISSTFLQNGQDLLSHPIIKLALSNVEQGEIDSLTEAFSIVVGDKSKQPINALMMLAPVWRDPYANKNFSNLDGILFVVYQSSALLNSILAQSGVRLDIHIYSGKQALSKKLIFDSDRQEIVSQHGNSNEIYLEDSYALRSEEILSFGQHHWLIEAKAAHEFYHSHPATYLTIILAGGFLLSCMLGLLTSLILRRQRHVFALAEKMSRGMQTSEARLERVIKGTSDGIWEFDSESEKFYFSDRLYALLGFTAEGVIRKKTWLRERIPEANFEQEIQAFSDLQKTEGAFVRDV